MLRGAHVCTGVLAEVLIGSDGSSVSCLACASPGDSGVPPVVMVAAGVGGEGAPDGWSLCLLLKNIFVGCRAPRPVEARASEVTCNARYSLSHSPTVSFIAQLCDGVADCWFGDMPVGLLSMELPFHSLC